MAATTQVAVTKAWVKLSDGDCTVQADYAGDFYHIAINPTAPSGSASIKMKLDEPVTFAYKTAVYCKLASNSKRTSAPINVIK